MSHRVLEGFGGKSHRVLEQNSRLFMLPEKNVCTQRGVDGPV